MAAKRNTKKREGKLKWRQRKRLTGRGKYIYKTRKPQGKNDQIKKLVVRAGGEEDGLFRKDEQMRTLWLV